ncbi:mucin-22-like [Hyperolius riggenbachi]|uniref:mucin-22-like n=1 Tax=Hyperolius riggenbachi TaxID=752182 RepID=UPI0035A2F4D0
MKITLIWFCLLAKVTASPQEPPTDTEKRKPCCVEAPKLLFKGYDSKHNINVYLFQFPPLGSKPKAKVKDENGGYQSDTESEVKGDGTPNAPSGSGETNGHSAVETNTPVYAQGSDVLGKTVSSLIDSTYNSGGEHKKNILVFSGTSMSSNPGNIRRHTSVLSTHSAPRKNDSEEYKTEINTSHSSSMNEAVNSVTNDDFNTESTQQKADLASSNTPVNSTLASINGHVSDLAINSGSKTTAKNDIEVYGTANNPTHDTTDAGDTQKTSWFSRTPVYGTPVSVNGHASEVSANSFLETTEINDIEVYGTGSDESVNNVTPTPEASFINVTYGAEAEQITDLGFSNDHVNSTPDSLGRPASDLSTSTGPIATGKTNIKEYDAAHESNMTATNGAKTKLGSEEGMVNVHSDVGGYYSTGGITPTDFPIYDDKEVTTPDPNVQFPYKDTETDNLPECIITDNKCRDPSTHTDGQQVTDSTARKETTGMNVSPSEHESVTLKIKDQSGISDGGHQKMIISVKEKSRKQPSQPKKRNKKLPTIYSNGRNTKISSKYRQLYQQHYRGHSRYFHFRHSSSESESDSSQRLD